MKKSFVLGMLIIAMTLLETPAQSDDKSESSAPGKVARQKQTSLGLYVTAEQAYRRWQAAPEAVKILDVRTPEEYIYVGHPEMAVNIPFAFQTYRWNEKKRSFDMEPNREFLSQVKDWAEPTDMILVMCRSGGRSAKAVNLLAEAGFKNVFNIIDGMEGDKVDDPGSVYFEKRMKNGWKNSGLPWTYEIDPERMRLPHHETPERNEQR